MPPEPEDGMKHTEAMIARHDLLIQNRQGHDILSLKKDTVKYYGLVGKKLKCIECGIPGGTQFCLQCTRIHYWGILFVVCKQCGASDGKHNARWAGEYVSSDEEEDEEEDEE